MHILRGFLKVCIALFVVWHITAIGIYSLYHVDEQPVLKWLDSKRSIVRPYVLATSQWQRWNLFSPDPLRRVIEMTISKQRADGSWEEVLVLNEDNVGFWQRASELKIMRRMEDESKEKLQERYVHDLCVRQGIPVGTQMHMTKRWFVIPKHEEMHSEEWWNQWQPDWQTTELVTTTCPAEL